MKREVLGLFVVVFLLSFVSSLSYSYNFSNVSIIENYSTGDKLSGKFNLTLKNAPLDLSFSSNLGSVNIRDYLKNQSSPVSCESNGCEPEYFTSGNGYESISDVSLPQGTKKEFAFFIQDYSVSISNLSMSFSSNFSKSNVIPFSVEFADGFSYSYQVFSDDFTRQVSNGCFSNNLTTYSERSVQETPYCEKMNLESSSVFLLGANISGSGNKEFTFTLKDNSFMDIDSCDISVSSSTYSSGNSCIIETESIQQKADYYVCIAHKADGDSGYKLRSEVSGQNCGSYGSSISSTSLADYSIYAKLPKYDSAQDFSINFDQNIGSLFNYYLQTNYNNDCSAGCVVPFRISGVNQKFDINSVKISYSSATGDSSVNRFYELSKSVPKYNFSGQVSLDSLLWKVASSGNFTLSLQSSEAKSFLFSRPIRVMVLPIIESIFPLNPPAGVETILFADVKQQGNVSRYEWDFGDGSELFISDKPFASHTFGNISTYSVRVTYGQGNYSSTKIFNVTTVSPKDSLNLTFNVKRARLSKASNDLNYMPSLYKSYLSNKVDLQSYLNEINTLDIARTGSAYSPQDFLGIAKELSEISVPWSIYVSEKKTGPMFFNYDSFDPSIIEEITPSGIDNSAEYKAVIFEWQKDNSVSTLTRQEIAMIKEDGSTSTLITVYDVSVQSKSSQESYLIIQENFESINPSSNVEIRKIGNSSAVILGPEESITFSFYLEGDKDSVLYLAPKLDALNINTEVGICNANLVCEKNEGENYKNCRSDCKPIWPTIWWLIFILFVSLIIYTCLQVWYKMKYEKYLFKDRAELFNLVMFINNSHLNGMSDKDIEKALMEKSWSKEQIEYAIRKSRGKNPGMFEIIPIDKVIANIEKRKAEKNKQNKLAPPMNHYPIQLNRTGGLADRRNVGI